MKKMQHSDYVKFYEEHQKNGIKIIPIGIEVNGVANLIMLLQGFENGAVERGEFLDSAFKQTDLLLRYMLAIADSVNAGQAVPYWHQVRQNPAKYRTI